MLNHMSCGEVIDEMLTIKLSVAGTDEEIFTSEAWTRAFNIEEPIYSELCHDIYSIYKFDEVCADDELRTKKIIKFRLCGRAFSWILLEFAKSSKPGLQSMTSGQISSGLDLTYAPSTIITQQPTECELDLLFEAMYDYYIVGQPSAATRTVLATQAPQCLQTPKTSTTIADTAPTPTNSSSQATNIPNTSRDLNELEPQQQHVQQQDNQASL
ncbi:hypothetical protein Tco_1114683 [Tanacetum coccineum]|uniref:Uncharacterized protein n=1 Tax=Tanacetum coccineum TaxID=301880 RepID=A0ABQ5IXA1_9ASTR